MDNPFVYDRELLAGELVDRTAEVAEVRAALLQGKKHFLVGPRRYGKTSILNAGAHAARRGTRGGVVLQYNVETFPRLTDLAGRIVADTARFLRGRVDKVAGKLKRLFSSVRPRITYDPGEGVFTVGFDLAPRAEAVPLFVDVLHGLERAAVRERRRIGLILDEFQLVVAPGGVAAEHQVRGAVQSHRRVGYVFAGSDTRMLEAMTRDPGRPFYRLGTVRFLEEIPRRDFDAHLRRGFRRLQAVVTTESRTAILDEADDVPYNVQLLAHACWEALRAEGAGAELTPEGVRGIHEAEAGKLNPVFSGLWAGLTEAQKVALQAVRHEQGRGLFTQATAERYRQPASTMQAALDGLVQKGICRRAVRGGEHEALVRLEDPLFGAWLRARIPAPSPST